MFATEKIHSACYCRIFNMLQIQTTTCISIAYSCINTSKSNGLIFSFSLLSVNMAPIYGSTVTIQTEALQQWYVLSLNQRKLANNLLWLPWETLTSSNHRHYKVRGTPGYHPVQTPAHHRHLQQFSHDCVQSGFKYLQGQRLHTLSGYLVPVFDHPFSTYVFP